MSRMLRAATAALRRRVLLPGLAAALCAGACGSGPVRDDSAGTTTADPWRVRGSVTAGPIVGTPPGPYAPRP